MIRAAVPFWRWSTALWFANTRALAFGVRQSVTLDPTGLGEGRPRWVVTEVGT